MYTYFYTIENEDKAYIFEVNYNILGKNRPASRFEPPDHAEIDVISERIIEVRDENGEDITVLYRSSVLENLSSKLNKDWDVLEAELWEDADSYRDDYYD